jgi:L-threonylcarbamoyladenylate synthase
MRRVPKHDQDSTDQTALVLRTGGLVILPTDTFYGLSASLSNGSGYRNIVRLKGAPKRRFLYLADSLDMVERHIASWGCGSKEEMRSHWPAPLTAVFPAAGGSPLWIGDTLALRVPDDEWLQGVIHHVGEPLLSTSVNLTGGAPLHDADSIDRLFGTQVDLMVVGDALPVEKPSTLVDLTGSSARVIRRGSYDWPTGTNPSK